MLTSELVVHKEDEVVGRKGSGGALPVNQQLLPLAFHQVLLNLGYITRYITNDKNINII